jgi:hypothetical protein
LSRQEVATSCRTGRTSPASPVPAVALIPGAGTLQLTRVAADLEKSLDKAKRDEQTNWDTLNSVEAMLAIGDEAVMDAELLKPARRFAANPAGSGGEQSVSSD